MTARTPEIHTNSQLKRNAVIACIIAMLAIGSTIPTAVEPFTRSTSWEPFANLFSGVLPTLAWLVALVLVLRDRIETGIQLGLIVSLVSIPATSYWMEGAAIANAVAVGVGTTIIAGVCLRPTLARWYIGAGLFAAVASILIDGIGPSQRLISQQDTLFVVAVTAVSILALIIFLFLQFPNYSLRTKLVIVFVGLALLSTLAITVVATQAIRNSLIETVAQDLRSRAQAAALAVGIAVERNVDRLETMALDTRLQDEVAIITDSYPPNQLERMALVRNNAERWGSADPQDSVIRNALNGNLSSSLRQFASVFVGNQDLFITDGTGSVIAARDWQPTYNFSEEPWWRVAYNDGLGSLYIGQPEFNPLLNEYGIRMAVPVYSEGQNRVVGVVHSIFGLSALQRALAANAFGDSGKVDMFFPPNQVLTADGTFRALQEKEASETTAGVGASLATLNYRGTPLLSSQAPVGGMEQDSAPYLAASGWRTIATIQPDEALSAVDAGAQAALLTGLATIGIAVIAALVLAQFLTRPIRRLTLVAEQVQQGDLAARAPVESSDEIGTLAVSFNSMTARLQDTLSGLERRVTERTQELATANLNLQSNAAYLSALSDTSTGLFERLDVSQVLQAIVERAGALVGTQHGFVFYGAPDESDIEMRVGSGLYDDLIGTRAQRGVGLAGTVWQTGEARVIDDYQKWEGRLPGSRRDALHAILAVPLKRAARSVGAVEGKSDETIGVIGLASTESDRKFGKTEVEIVQRFAQLASIALDNAQLYATTENRVRELDALNTIGQMVVQPGEFSDVIGQVGDEVLKIFSADFGYLAVYNPDTDLLEFPYAVDEGKRISLAPIPVETGITAQVLRSGEPMLLSNATEDDYERIGAIDSGDGSLPQSLLAVPIRAGERVVGVLSVQRVENERSFSEDDQVLLTTIAASIGVSLENARLLRQTQAALLESRVLAARERESSEQLMALNRRLTREGWREYLEQLNSELVVEAGGGDGASAGNGLYHQGNGNGASESGSSGVGNGHNRVKVPIELRGEVIGEIELEGDDNGNPMSVDDITLVAQVAENIGLALDNARLYSETQQRMTELDALNNISQAVTTELDLDPLLDMIGSQLQSIFDVQNVYIALYDSNSQMISLPYFVNDGVRETVPSMRYGEGITSHILRTRQPLIVNEDSQDRMVELGAKTFGNTARSYLGVPIVVGDDVTGVISIQSSAREGLFDDDDVRLMETIAATVGAAIQNAQLYGAMQLEVVTRQRAEEEIKLSLKEKEVLLKEIHHRVKNNLQIITSLLNLQSAQLKDPEASALFRESQARVRSMALIHEKLYQSKDLARVDFDAYVRDLIVYLFRSFAINPDQVRTRIETNGMFLGIDTAIPCGLIISELVTNALKYAFPDGRRGELYVGLGPADGDKLLLEVSDNGVGFREDFDWRESDSLGLQLVSTLANQLHGTMQVSGVGGASFRLVFNEA